MADLFGDAKAKQPRAETRPLADLLRPQTLPDVVGQDHLVGPEGPLGKMVAAHKLSSMIFWGPPGCGKTTLARILSHHTDLHFETISAIFSGVAELRKIFDSAKLRAANGKGTLLFVDEIHRFNKSQQDAFLPVVEDGTVVLIGATTENPSFELNSALLSRAQVFVLKRLDDAALEILLARAEAHYQRKLPVTLEARENLKAMADGDGRYILTLAEQVFTQADEELDLTGLMSIVQRRAPLYDKKDDGHYNLISALHKSVRGSDADAALYWFCRMLAGGEHPEYIARRMVRMAVEDIGLADPHAMPQAIAAWETYERLGSPEGELALAQALVYLATAPKSNAVYMAYKAGQRTAKETGSLMPPKRILNAPTKLMKNEGYGKGYNYDHDTPEAFSGQDYFPDEMERENFYDPPDRGFEREIRKRLDYWQKLREEKKDRVKPDEIHYYSEMKIILLIALGGAFGSVARYLVGKASLLLWGPDFPWGTLIVNVVGCFIMGIFAGLLTHYTELSQEVRSFFMIGILGGFTTFSAFALDVVALYERGAFLNAGLYFLASVIASIAALMVGLFVMRTIYS